jgi:hypothetical protein
MDVWYDLVISDLEHLIDVTEPAGTEARREWPPAREPMGNLGVMSSLGHSYGSGTSDAYR